MAKSNGLFQLFKFGSQKEVLILNKREYLLQKWREDVDVHILIFKRHLPKKLKCTLAAT
jgi:hypothetical protein